MKLIVGLGNPGKKYEKTRHNMGFSTIDLLSDMSRIDVDKEAFHGLVGRGKIYDHDVLLFKPTTYMNLSGTAVQEIVHFYKIAIEDILVVYDDMALKPGQIRLRLGGSSGGQKGIANIIQCLGTDKIARIRIGIGEPENHDVVDYVLGKPIKEDQEKIDQAIANAVEAIKEVLKAGFDRAMCKFN